MSSVQVSQLLTRAAIPQAGGKVALLEKETFPRDKYCGAAARGHLKLRTGLTPNLHLRAGDAVCTPAIRILTEMGVMQVRELLLVTSQTYR